MANNKPKEKQQPKETKADNKPKETRFVSTSRYIEHFVKPNGEMVSLAPGEEVSLPPGAAITKRLLKLKKIRKA